MIYTPIPRGVSGSSHPEAVPVLVQVNYAGIKDHERG